MKKSLVVMLLALALSLGSFAPAFASSTSDDETAAPALKGDEDEEGEDEGGEADEWFEDFFENLFGEEFVDFFENLFGGGDEDANEADEGAEEDEGGAF
ncbi:MAG: hypothetical protein NUW37_18305 [Planctomycetes bacterium]|nr:hypothetical protein [Planctomycetota bacterium]